MKKSGRIGVLLLVLAHVAVSRGSRIRELMEMTGYSRTAMFRLLRVARDELGVVIEADRGAGYVVLEWGLLNGKAIVKKYGGMATKWIKQRTR